MNARKRVIALVTVTLRAPVFEGEDVAQALIDAELTAYVVNGREATIEGDVFARPVNKNGEVQE